MDCATIAASRRGSARAGAMGDATQATADKGEALAEFGARAFIALLRDVDRFALDAP